VAEGTTTCFDATLFCVLMRSFDQDEVDITNADSGRMPNREERETLRRAVYQQVRRNLISTTIVRSMIAWRNAVGLLSVPTRSIANQTYEATHVL
jgi:hypothetical protein